MKKRFYLDRQGGMMMGVCAGLGRYFGVDATFIRVGVVLVTLLGAFPWTLLAYGAAAYLAKPRPTLGGSAEDAPTLGGSTWDYKANSREIDRRLAEVDTYVARSNTNLAKEIEELR